MNILDTIKQKARSTSARIVLPEGTEARVLKAAAIIVSEGIANPIVIGKKIEVEGAALALGTSLDNVEIVDTETFEKGKYADIMVEMRGAKGLTREQALQDLNNPLVLAALMVKAGDADGEIAGSINSTGNVLRPAFQYVRTMPNCKTVSGAFLMMLPEGTPFGGKILVFADCAVLPNPDATQLAEIAIATARTAKALVDIEPRVALLSFSTYGSASHEMVDKVVEATQKVKALQPELAVDGELQVDAAIVSEVGKLKAPTSSVAGSANVLVFPTLEAGNIGYKLVQRLAGAEAVGPILQGMAAPIHDLSRGCSVSDIVNMTAIASVQAQAKG